MGPQNTQVPTQTPWFQSIQQMLSGGAIPGLHSGRPGVRVPNVTPTYNSSLFTPSTATRTAALADPSSIANPVSGTPGSLFKSGPGFSGPAGSSPSSFGVGTTGTNGTSGSDPVSILMNMLSGGGGSAPGGGSGFSASVSPTGGYTSGPGAGAPVRTAVPVNGLNGPNIDASGNPTAAGYNVFSDWMNQMFNKGVPFPGAPAIAPLPGFDVASSTGARIDPNAASAADALGGGGKDANGNPIPGGPTSFSGLMQALTGSALLDANMGSGGTIGGGSAVTAPTISHAGEDTQTLDQILQNTTGANSTFTNTILPALNAQFKQANDITAASAKESAGNLTGSGFANTLSTALNRNTATQQSTLADTLVKLASQEQARQQAGAQIAAGQNTAQAGIDLAASTTSAQLAQQAQALALQARQSGRADLLAQSQMLMQQAEAQAQLEQQNSQFNAGAANSANSQYFNAGVQRNEAQAAMQNNDWLSQFGAANNQSAQNASMFMQLLSMIFGGGQANTLTSSGVGAMFPGLMSLIATLA